MTFYLLIVFLFGLIVGSFLNVVILRYNTGKSINGRSGCLTCGHGLKAYELIPVFSYLFLKGRCSVCGSKISLQYPFVELSTGLLFLAIFFKFFDPLSTNYYSDFILPTMFFWTFFSLIVVVFVYDIKHKIIPDGISYTLALMALLYRITLTDFGSLSTLSILDLLSGLILFTPFFLLWFFSKGKWIGLGDGKLALSIGWLSGFVYGISSVVLAFWIGAFVSVLYLLIFHLKGSSSNITMKSEIPFAPFLILGLIIMFFYPFDVLGIKLFF